MTNFHAALPFLGTHVDKSLTAANGAVAAFTVSGGPVLITSLLGRVTTPIGATVATLKLALNPTAAGATLDLCTAVAVTSDVADVLYTISGVFSEALNVDNVGAEEGLTKPFYIPVGSLEAIFSADPVGGVILWTIHYVPIEAGALVVAA